MSEWAYDEGVIQEQRAEEARDRYFEVVGDLPAQIQVLEDAAGIFLLRRKIKPRWTANQVARELQRMAENLRADVAAALEQERP